MKATPTAVKTLEVLKASTQDIRAAYQARYEELSLAQLKQDREGLAAVGMDAQKYAPYPSGNEGREAYRAGVAKHNRVRRYFKSTASFRGWNSPDPVVEVPGSEDKLRAAGRVEADAVVDSYLCKLAKKIGKEITSCTTNGNIWDYAYLEVTCVDEEVQKWRTNCIINRSVYGLLFNQWPTRLMK